MSKPLPFVKVFDHTDHGQVLVMLVETQEQYPAMSLSFMHNSLCIDNVFIAENEEQQRQIFDTMDEDTAFQIVLDAVDRIKKLKKH